MTLDASTFEEIGALNGEAFDGEIRDMVAVENEDVEGDLPAVLVLTKHSLYKVVTVPSS